MKVWLDDERDPKDEFIQERFMADPDSTWAKTAKEAIELLKTNEVTEISLDHDLNDSQDGIAVAKFIELAAYEGSLPKLRVRFHTQNLVGRENMKAAIRQAMIYWRLDE